MEVFKMAVTTKKAEATVEIRPLDIRRVPIRIIGDSPLIVHAWSEKAKRMMLGTGDKLAAIAADSGFCNASYFSKVFREIVGQSPRKWRMTQKQTGRDSLVR